MLKKKNVLLILVFILFFFSCKKDEFSFDDISNTINVDYNLAAPLIVGSFSLSELAENDDDSILVIDGDTVKAYIRSDDILNYSVEDFTDIPEQQLVNYFLSPAEDVDISASPSSFVINELVTDTSYTIDLENGVRIDSVTLQEAYITLFAQNEFLHGADLVITSDNVIDGAGNTLSETVYINPGSFTSENIDISGRTVIFNHTAEGETQIALNFTPVFQKTPGNNLVDSDNFIDIDFGFEGLNDFETFFGFVGFMDVGFDSTLTIEADELYNLTGTFNVTNPKIIFNYNHSLGVKMDINLQMHGYHSDAPDVDIDPGVSTLDYSDDYRNPYTESSLVYSNTTIPNIHELVAFPVPDSVSFIANIQTNVGLDSITDQNFVHNDSELNIGVEIEVPMEFSANLTYKDTLELPEFEDIEELVYFDYANLHYWFTNDFPVGFSIKTYLYDSANVQIVDSIMLNGSGQYFLTPAPVDANGVVIQEQVQEIHGMTSLDADQADNLIRNSSHIIVEAKIQTYEFESVKLLDYYELLFQFGIEAQGRYEGELE